MLTACVHQTSASPRPALLVNPSAEDKQLLVTAIESQLGISDLVLKDEALTQRSELVLERRSQRSLARTNQANLVEQAPIIVRLLLVDDDCIVANSVNPTTTKLAGVTCELAEE